MYLKYLPYILEWALFPFFIGAHVVLFSKIISNQTWTYKECILISFRMWPKIFIANIVCDILVLIGLVVLVIPGLILAARFSFFQFLIVLDGYGPISALKKSGQMTKKYLPFIIGSYLIILAPMILAYILIRGPLSIIFYSGFYPALISNILVEILTVWFLVLFYRFYCLYNEEKHDNPIKTDAIES